MAVLARRLPVRTGPRIAHRDRQRQLGRILAREAAAGLLGQDVAALGIGGGGDTRPVLLRAGRLLRSAHLAIAHSGAWACAAATCAPHGIGIDVQELRARPAGPLARHMGWHDWLAGADESSLRDRFTQAWTLWEAAAKCDDSGVLECAAPAFNALAAGLLPGQEGEWTGGVYRAHTLRLDSMHWLTVVARDAGNAGYSSTEHRRA